VVEDRNGYIIILAVYSPPRHAIKGEHYITFFKTLGNRFIAAGNYNIKHTHWRSRLNLPKGCELFKAIEDMYLVILSIKNPSIRHLIMKIPLIYSVLSGAFLKIIAALSLELSSDYSPVIFTTNSKIMNANFTLSTLPK
jgi:hypothetical protein